LHDVVKFITGNANFAKNLSLVVTDSKVIIFLITAVLIGLASSCKKNENDVIPDVYIDFTVDLSDPEFVTLNTLGGSVAVDARTNNWGVRAAGFDGNGIIVCAWVDKFYAYDMTCPHDYVNNGLSIKLNVDPSSSMFAICPECGTKYALTAGGTPASGPGKFPLKNYKTNFDGRFIHVWNNN
jgi:nitrite reductase/ring-hydroxylating ferredoxin subunit